MLPGDKMSDSEFLLEDGRKAEKVEIDQGKVKVTEIYVEPKQEKKLSQRITEKYCVCERQIETIDETTGEVVSTVIEKVSGDDIVSNSSQEKSPMQLAVENKLNNKKISVNHILMAVIAVQILGIVYFLFLR